jgi:uncharacterized membrane protein YcgQ (UPF0703/DUF1980 family)
MEETILNIFNENSSDANNGQMSVVTEDSYSDVAKEITQHVFEFVEWVKQNNEVNLNGFVTHPANPHFTPEHLYKYWLNNIHNER